MKGPLRRRLAHWYGRALTLVAIGYPLSLLGVWALLGLVGERWWPTSLALYLPGLGFAAPLPLVLLLLALARRGRLLLAQLASLLILLFPILGLTLNLPSAEAPIERRLRIASYNVNSGRGGSAKIARELLALGPDVVFVQEAAGDPARELAELLKSELPHSLIRDELLVASKFPIAEAEVPERLEFFGQHRSPRFMKLKLATRLGPITFFNVHTVSPRGGFYQLRGSGLRREIASGRLLAGENAQGIYEHAALRALQIETLASMAGKERNPVVIVGDTNLPRLSPIRRRFLGQFRDGFAEAGFGFGNTFPSKFPWMRIDLVLSTHDLTFTRFQVGGDVTSDHLHVVADVIPAER